MPDGRTTPGTAPIPQHRAGATKDAIIPKRDLQPGPTADHHTPTRLEVGLTHNRAAHLNDDIDPAEALRHE